MNFSCMKCGGSTAGFGIHNCSSFNTSRHQSLSLFSQCYHCGVHDGHTSYCAHARGLRELKIANETSNQTELWQHLEPRSSEPVPVEPPKQDPNRDYFRRVIEEKGLLKLFKR